MRPIKIGVIKKILCFKGANTRTIDNSPSLIWPSLRIISHKHKIIYFAIAKTGSSSVKAALSELLGVAATNLPRVKPREIKNFFHYFKFAFVRNPWDRILSCYLDKIKQDKNFNDDYFKNGVAKHFIRFQRFKAGMKFNDFVKVVSRIPDEDADAHFMSQYRRVYNKKSELLVDYLGRFENLENDFMKVMKKCGIENISLPHIHSSNRKKHYSEYYDEKTKKMIAKRYKKDIKLLNYKFEKKT